MNYQPRTQPIWHPCAQMKDYESFHPLQIVGAEGCYLQLANGRQVIDAISSWWCKSLGHQHPRLREVLIKQARQFEHVILANTTNDVILELSQRLTALTNSLNKVLYASDGSSAVEIALKLCLHAQAIKAKPRHQFICLQHAYHGETAGALSVSDVGLYKNNYQSMLFDVITIKNIPYVHSQDDPLWHNCDQHWQRIAKQLAPYANTACAIIVEPVVQGAGGMKIYSPALLRHLRAWTEQHQVYLIADEIMTGLGRTGRVFAYQHADIEPDLVCVAKNLTAGWLPLSAVLVKQALFDLCYDDYATGKAFLHSHTHSGNVLAASVALEFLNILQEQQLQKRAIEIGKFMLEQMQHIADETQMLTHVRGVGGIVAADLITSRGTSRFGYMVYQEAVKCGALLRPLGNTIYWLPPLNIKDEELAQLAMITQQALKRSKNLCM